jgi:hypothetical protein
MRRRIARFQQMVDWWLVFWVSCLFWGCGVTALVTYLFTREKPEPR